jgi:hypothetical protein
LQTEAVYRPARWPEVIRKCRATLSNFDQNERLLKEIDTALNLLDQPAPGTSTDE